MPFLRPKFLETTTDKTRLSLALLGIVFIGLIWLGVWLQIRSEKRSMIEIARKESGNLALVYSQNVERTAAEMDRMLKYLRATYDRAGENADWPTIVEAEFNTSNRIAQIAIIGRDGFMITSSKLLYPKEPLNLGDREHFLVHAQAQEDKLFISKPVLGRVSKRWSVQFTRPFFDGSGSFAGVIVVSLDTSYLTSSFGALTLGQSGGLALMGADGVVRSGAGIYEADLGDNLLGLYEKLLNDLSGERMAVADDPDAGPIVTVLQDVPGFDLKAILKKSDFAQYDLWRKNRIFYLVAGAILSVLVAVAVIASLYQHLKASKWMEYLANTDPLTGLHNRRALMDTLDRIFDDGQSQQKQGLLIVDLDRFKDVNDRFGHPVGDKILKRVASRLRRLAREPNFIARLGGDKFAIVTFAQADSPTNETLASWICSEMRQPFEVDGLRHEIGCSVGIVEDLRDFGTPVEGLRRADLALYAAKSEGRNCWRHYSAELDARVARRVETEADLRAAIRENQFDVLYQPIVSASTGELVTVEALVRWNHPRKGLVSPQDFISIAEQTGLIVHIGRWVLERACSDLASCKDGPAVAVNVSAIEFRDDDYYSTVKSVLQRTGLAPSRLKLEITESVLMSTSPEALHQLDLLREYGVAIALDDFGTGYSSLGYLQSYPIDCIKIDRSFVRQMRDSGVSQAIVRAIANMAQEMSISTVAEGVEDHDLETRLRDLGCSELQGYLFGKPMPFGRLLENHSRSVQQLPTHRIELQTA